MNIFYTTEAINDIEHIYNYIAEDSLDIAIKTIKKLEASVALVKDNPYIGYPGRKHTTRELFINGTKYYLIYRINEIKTQIEILTFLHSSRNY